MPTGDAKVPPFFKIHPQLTFRPDAQAEVSNEDLQQLEARLQSFLHGQVRDFRIELREGGLVLHGHTRTYYGKQLAQEAVRQASQMPIASNDIAVA
jgi:hypothetical protein